MQNKIHKINALTNLYPIRPLIALNDELVILSQVGVNERSLKMIKRYFIVMKNFKPSEPAGVDVINSLKTMLTPFISELEAQLTR